MPACALGTFFFGVPFILSMSGVFASAVLLIVRMCDPNVVSCKVVPCHCLPPTWCCDSGARKSKRPVLNLPLLLMTVKLRLPIVLYSRRLLMLPGSSTRARVLSLILKLRKPFLGTQRLLLHVIVSMFLALSLCFGVLRSSLFKPSGLCWVRI